MAMRNGCGHWIASGVALSVIYACSGTANVTSGNSPNSITGGSAGDTTSGGTTGTGGSSSGGSANSATGGTISVTGGTAGAVARGGKGGKGGSATGGSSQGGESEGGAGDDYSAAGLPDINFTYDPPMGGQGGACASETGEATLRKRPMDVIVAIDNSESMAGEIQQVQARINGDFAAILDASGIDYRVILVSRYGNVFIHNFDHGGPSDSAYSICIGAPLSTLTCPTTSADGTTPPLVNNPNKFYQHSTDIGSNDMWCRLMDAYTHSDPYPNPRTHAVFGAPPETAFAPVAPNGWSAFVRKQAYKVFIGITDDSPTTDSTLGCPNLLSGTNEQTWATQFDTALRALDPAQFQTASGDRNYVWYSIVGFAGNAVTNPTPLTPADPVETRCCKGDGTAQTTCQGTMGQALQDSSEPGLGYQYLSILTGGLRYPSCYNSNFNDIFNKIAEGVIENAQASCEYDVPKPTHGIVDFDQTKVSYKPGAGANVPLTRHQSDADCGADQGFYFSSDFSKIELCPSTCTAVEGDSSVKVAIDFGCLGS